MLTDPDQLAQLADRLTPPQRCALRAHLQKETGK